MDEQKLPYDLGILADAFDLAVATDCPHLEEWLNATTMLDVVEQTMFDYLYEQVKVDGKYWNEEELKIRFIGGLFAIAKIDVADKIKVFYERPLAATIDHFRLTVVADCLVATPLKFNSPQKPYFFLQEYKKGRGEAKDPEAQMLTAMLIAQAKNQDGLPIYGSYVIGGTCYFTTLAGRNYCSSRLYDAANRDDLFQIVATLRQLKEIILNRP
ncbi:MAG: hypothetical protein ACOYNY_36875 [Caldilineaceae bacterium]|jgi:hypothetical protein